MAGLNGKPEDETLAHVRYAHRAAGSGTSAGNRKTYVRSAGQSGPACAAWPVRRRPRRAGSPTVIAHAPESRFVTVQGARIHYLRWGDPAKPGLLLVHGNAAHAYWWSFIAPFLARDYHVAAMDLSGMGDSEWRAPHGEAGGYSMDIFAAEELAVLEDAGMFAARQAAGDRGPFLWRLCHHEGGRGIWRAAGRHRHHRFAGQSAGSQRKRAGGDPTDHKPRPHNIYPSLAAALARFRLMPPQICENLFLLDWVARHSLKEVTGPDGESGFTWKFDPAIWRHFSIGDTAALLKATRCRVAVFRGEHSVLMPPRIGDYIFDLLDRAAPVVEIPEAQHHIMLDQPLALVAALRALLADWEHSVATRRPG